MSIKWLCVSYVLTVLLLATSFVHVRMDARYLGGPLFYGSDRSHYVIRLQEGLLNPFGNTGNGIFSVPKDTQGLQPAGLEQIGGLLLGWTGWRGTEAMIVLSVLLGALVVPILQRLLVRTGIKESSAFVGSFLYFFLFFSPIGRFVHQSWSFSLTLLSLLLFWRFFEMKSVRRAVIAGIAMGMVPYIYYWSWTFVWSIAAMLFLLTLVRREHLRHLWSWFFFWLTLGIVAAPYFWHIISLMGLPVAREAAERSSLVLSHGIESYSRSILTLLLALCGFFTLGRRREAAQFLPVASGCIATFVVLHQQFLHGNVISFSTHYYPYICLIALLFSATLIAKKQWNALSIGSLLLCTIFLGAALIDYRDRNPLQLAPENFAYQHFKSILPVLDSIPKQVVLTDLESVLVIAANTKHDVVFTEHARHLLIPTTEYAERYCLTTLLAPNPHVEWIAKTLVETGRLGRARQDQLYTERLKITTEACARVRSAPQEWLHHYGVTLLLWNEKSHPEWKVDPSLFTLQDKGDGWSTWTLTSLSR